MGSGGTIRDADDRDAPACAAIYAHYVSRTAISFESEPPTAEQMAGRIEAAQRKHAWLVLEVDGQVVGYAYGGEFKPRDAYRWSGETSIYLAAGHRGRGAGRALYGALLERLRARGYRTAAAGMTLPNPASAGLHAALGFEPVGTYRRIGFKDGGWHHVAWVQKDLGERLGAPPAEIV